MADLVRRDSGVPVEGEYEAPGSFTTPNAAQASESITPGRDSYEVWVSGVTRPSTCGTTFYFENGNGSNTITFR